MSDMLVEFKLQGGGRMVLDGAECDGSTWTGRDRQGKPYTLATTAVVGERLMRDRHGWVGGGKRRRRG